MVIRGWKASPRVTQFGGFMRYWVGIKMKSVEGGNLDRRIGETQESRLCKVHLVGHYVGGWRVEGGEGGSHYSGHGGCPPVNIEAILGHHL